MKKIIVFLLFTLSLISLVACNDDSKSGELRFEPKISVVDYEATSNSLEFTIECKNQEMVEENTINIFLYKNYGKENQVCVGSASIYSYYDTRGFSSLESNTVYHLKITCTFDGESGYEALVQQYQTLANE